MTVSENNNVQVGWTADGQRVVREDGGVGRLRVMPTPPYVPDREAMDTHLRMLAKAWPVLAEHAPHMDGNFDLSLSEVRRMVDALYRRVADLDVPPPQPQPWPPVNGSGMATITEATDAPE